MRVRIDGDGGLSLDEPEDFKKFSIAPSEKLKGGAKITAALQSLGEPAEENHYWLSADQVIELSGRGSDAKWVEQFWAMLEKVEPYGFADLQAKRVKAHIE